MRRKVLQDDWCEECKAESETMGHFILEMSTSSGGIATHKVAFFF